MMYKSFLSIIICRWTCTAAKCLCQQGKNRLFAGRDGWAMKTSDTYHITIKTNQFWPNFDLNQNTDHYLWQQKKEIKKRDMFHNENLLYRTDLLISSHQHPWGNTGKLLMVRFRNNIKDKRGSQALRLQWLNIIMLVIRKWWEINRIYLYILVLVLIQYYVSKVVR